MLLTSFLSNVVTVPSRLNFIPSKKCEKIKIKTEVAKPKKIRQFASTSH